MLMIKYTEKDDRMAFPTPTAVQSYIIDFDAGDTVEPFTFRLDRRNRVFQQRDLATREGKQLDAARQKVKSRKQKVERVTTNPKSTAAEQARAQELLEDATAELADVQTRIGDKPRTVTDRPPKPATGPENGDRVISSRAARTRKGSRTSHVREYGLRTMRINQARAAKGRPPLDA
jgi:hypothetical protein